MDKQSVLIGEIIIDQEPRIALYAETDIPVSREGIAVLKDKLASLLDARFRPADPPELHREMTIGEVIETWHCYRSTVLRLIREGLLHPAQQLLRGLDYPWAQMGPVVSFSLSRRSGC